VTRLILVTGAGGQIGREILETAASLGVDAVGLDRARLDITQERAVAATLDAHEPAVLINCAAYTAVDRAEAGEAAAFAVNRDGAGLLARECARRGVALLHFSTDYVFDGRATWPYRESDPVAPLSVYGRSKAAGEAAVLAEGGRALILRTGWVFGRHGGNFVKTMLRLGVERSELRIVADQIGGPTPAAAVARHALTLAGWLAVGRDLPAVLHAGGGPPVSWLGFAEAIFAAAAMQGYAPPNLVAIGTADYPTPARRPASSVLDDGVLRALGLAPIAWQEEMAAVVGVILAGAGR
jgi:dTDP-4-dehydrorhamnose reductase